MDTPPYDLQEEQRAERHAYTLLFNARSFTHSVRREGIADSIQVVTPKGDCVTIHARQAYDARTWKKFLASRSPKLMALSLSVHTQPLQQEYFAWLLTFSPSRFSLLTTDAQFAWLRRVVEIAVAWHLLEEKAESANDGTGPALADPWIAAQMVLHFLRRSLVQECARLIHHAVKHKLSAQELIAQLVTTLDNGIPTQWSLSSPALLFEASVSDQQANDQTKEDHGDGAQDTNQPVI